VLFFGMGISVTKINLQGTATVDIIFIENVLTKILIVVIIKL